MNCIARKLICVILCISFLPVTAFADTEDEYDRLRSRWEEYLTGGDYAAEGEVYTDYIAPKVTAVANAGEKWQNAMVDKSQFKALGYIWSDIQPGDTMNEYTRHARNMSTCFNRIEAMALAYRTKGARNYGSAALRSSIIAALEYMYSEKYNENTPRTNRNLSPANPNENWYEWEIRAPESIVNTMILMYDELDKSMIDNYMKAIDKQIPSIGGAATGANRLDNCQTEIVGAIAQKNNERMKMGIEAIDVELVYSEIDDGFYADGSFIQHHNYPYNGGYGMSALEGLACIVYLFGGSEFMPHNPDYANMYDWVKNSFDSLSYEGRMMDSVRGRGVARASDTGYGLMNALVMLSQFAPKEYADYYKSMIRRWVDNNKVINPYNQVSSIFTINKLYEILQDESVTAQADKSFYKNFGAVDRGVMFRDGWAVNISMYSDRIRNFESINGENLQGWHTASGAMYIYNDDLDHYGNNYWATVDRYRIPGTTVVKKSTEPNGIFGNAYAGGAELDNYYGVNAMHYTAPDNADGSAAHDLNVKKAWFMLDEEVVCLGSGLTSSKVNDDIETIVENRKVDYFTQNLIIDGVTTSTADGYKETKYNVGWIYLRGNSKNTQNAKRTDLGYYFPYGETVTAKRETRTDSWRSVGNGSANSVSDKYMSVAIEHGKKPNAAEYAYAVIPGKTLAQVKAYAQNPGFEILSNTEKLQMVREKDTGVTGAVIWEDGRYEVGEFTALTAMMMLTKEEDGIVSLSVSDPTQKGKVLRLEFNSADCSVLDLDSGVGIDKTGDKTVITVNTAHALGKTFHVKLKRGSADLPQAPEAPYVQALSPTAVKISIDAEDAYDYHLVFSETETGAYIPVPDYKGDHGFIHRGLTPGKTYYYKLAASDARGMSEYSPVVSAVTPAAEPAETDGQIYETFDRLNEGPIAYQNGWTASAYSDRDRAEVVGDDDKRLMLYASPPSTGSTMHASISKQLVPMSGKIIAEGDFTVPDSNWKNMILLYSGKTVAVQVFANGGEIWTYHGSTWNTKYPFKDSTLETDKTYHITVIADTDTDTFEVYLDGRKLEYSVDKPLTFRNKVSSVDKYECMLPETVGTLYADNIRVHQGVTCLSAQSDDKGVTAVFYNAGEAVEAALYADTQPKTFVKELDLPARGKTETVIGAVDDNISLYLWTKAQKPLVPKISIQR